MLGLSILKSKVVIIKNNNKIFVYVVDIFNFNSSKELITKCYF